ELAATVDTLRGEIAEREQMEASLLRLHRLYAVLSETDQAIVRASERGSLFRDFCRIAVGQVRQVAAQGATGYLDELHIAAHEGPDSIGPTGISIREGGCCICNDFENDPR